MAGEKIIIKRHTADLSGQLIFMDKLCILTRAEVLKAGQTSAVGSDEQGLGLNHHSGNLAHVFAGVQYILPKQEDRRSV